jgi:hypothetical protein
MLADSDPSAEGVHHVEGVCTPPAMLLPRRVKLKRAGLLRLLRRTGSFVSLRLRRWGGSTMLWQ